MTPLLWNDMNMPSADDPSETLEQSVERLCAAIDYHVQRMDHIREVLATFYKAPVSASSLQPILDLAVELDPSLKATPAPSTIVRRHLVCASCDQFAIRDAKVADDVGVSLRCPLCDAPMHVASIELLPSPHVDDIITLESGHPF